MSAQTTADSGQLVSVSDLATLSLDASNLRQMIGLASEIVYNLGVDVLPRNELRRICALMMVSEELAERLGARLVNLEAGRPMIGEGSMS